MAKVAVLLRDVEGKSHIVVVSSITGVEYDPGKPAVKAEPAVEAVEGDPGEPASGANPGRPPKPAVEAKDEVKAEPGEPATCTIAYGGGSAKVAMKAGDLVDLLNS
jgi:hypothetical protein